MDMERRRAILISTASREPLDVRWLPMLHDDEMEYANARLQQCRMPYQWRWFNNVTSLTGAVKMQDASDDAAAELGSNLMSR